MNGENGGIEKYRRLQPHAIPPESRANLIPKVRVPDDTPEIFQVPGGDDDVMRSAYSRSFSIGSQ
jgi:hypothetical protein